MSINAEHSWAASTAISIIAGIAGLAAMVFIFAGCTQNVESQKAKVRIECLKQGGTWFDSDSTPYGDRCIMPDFKTASLGGQ